MAIPEPGTRLRGPLHEDDKRALHEAADWFTRLQAGDSNAEQRRQWRNWLEGSGANARAWAWMERVSGKLAGLDEPAASAVLLRSRSRRRAMGKTMLALLGLGLGSAATVGLLPLRAWSATYHAGIGPGRRILLDDGSTLWLDTDSAVNVDFTPTRRHLELVRGRIFIQTAADQPHPPRPFEVATPQGLLRPLGTQFAVRLANDRYTDLAVFEGQVASLPRDLPATDGLIVPAGNATQMDAHGNRALRPASRAMQAWTQGVLLADHVPLGEFLQELGRYRHGWISCDPGVANLILFGSYPLNDVDASLAAISRTLPVRVEKHWPGRITVTARTD